MAELLILAVFLLVLSIGGLMADHIFPRIKPLERFIDRLPMMREDEIEFAASRKENIA